MNAKRMLAGLCSFAMTTTVVMAIPCTTDAECSDSLYCNGVETCVSGTCIFPMESPCGTDPMQYCMQNSVVPNGACSDCMFDLDASGATTLIDRLILLAWCWGEDELRCGRDSAGNPRIPAENYCCTMNLYRDCDDGQYCTEEKIDLNDVGALACCYNKTDEQCGQACHEVSFAGGECDSDCHLGSVCSIHAIDCVIDQCNVRGDTEYCTYTQQDGEWCDDGIQCNSKEVCNPYADNFQWRGCGPGPNQDGETTGWMCPADEYCSEAWDVPSPPFPLGLDQYGCSDCALDIDRDGFIDNLDDALFAECFHLGWGLKCDEDQNGHLRIPRRPGRIEDLCCAVNFSEVFWHEDWQIIDCYDLEAVVFSPGCNWTEVENCDYCDGTYVANICTDGDDIPCLTDLNCTTMTASRETTLEACVSGMCVECDDDGDCSAPTPYCGPSNECVECTTDAHCQPPIVAECIAGECEGGRS